MYSASFSEASWSEIDKISTSNLAKHYFSVGDCKNITCQDNDTLTVEIIGFDHDDLASGGKVGITIGTKNLYRGIYQFNKFNGSSNNYEESSINDELNTDFYNSFDADLKSAIKLVKKKTGIETNGSQIKELQVKLFSFSEVEVTGSNIYSPSGEGTQYSRFTTTSSRQKRIQNQDGSVTAQNPQEWWLRSPRENTNNSVVIIGENGSSKTSIVGNGIYSYICFGFCV